MTQPCLSEDVIPVESSTSRRRFLRTGAVLGTATAAALLTDVRPAFAAAVPIYDVTDSTYAGGAVGNGTTDDAPAISAAITAGAATGGAFAVYFPLPPVAYALGSTLSIPDLCSLVGESGSLSKLLCLSTLTGPAVQNATSTGNTGLALRNLEIDGKKASRASVTAPVVKLSGGTSGAVTRVAITDCYVHDGPAAGVVLERASNVVVSGSEIAGNAGQGLSATGAATDIRVTQNMFRAAAADALVIKGDTGGTATSAASRVLVAENIFSGQTAGSALVLGGVSRAEVCGNLIDKPTAAGILVTNAGSTSTTDVLVTTNLVNEAGTVAVDVQAGVSGSGSVSDVRVERSSVKLPATAGIRVRSLSSSGSVTNAVVSDNTIICVTTSNSAVGLVVDGTSVVDPVVSGNVVANAGGGGIAVGDGTGSVTRPTVSSNKVRAGASTSLALLGCVSPMLYGNRASGAAIGLRLDAITGTINEFGNDATGTVDISYGTVPAAVARLGLADRAVLSGSGVPTMSAPIGSVYLNTAGTAGTTLYVRETATTWTAK